MNKTIRLQTLIEKGACPEQVKLFKRMFGDSVTLTEALTLEHCNSFAINWAATNLLISESYAKYAKIIGPAWAEYKKTCALAFFNLYDGDNIP